MIIGLDQGNSYYKLSAGAGTFQFKFPATLKKGKDIDVNRTDTIEIDGQVYTVGQPQDQSVTDINKTKLEEQKILTLAALARAANNHLTEFDIVAGLPVAYYSTQKADLMNSLKAIGQKRVVYNDVEMLLRIRNVDIFPQAAAPILTDSTRFKNKKILVIDLGGLTLDVCQFDNLKLTHFNSWALGVQKLYRRIAPAINNKYDLELKAFEMERILNEGLKIYGVKQDLTFIDSDILAHVEEGAANVKREFSYKLCDEIILIGGGGILLEKQLKHHFPNLQLEENGQMSNAAAFEKVGRLKYGSK